jgi:hypothetical protein
MGSLTPALALKASSMIEVQRLFQIDHDKEIIAVTSNYEATLQNASLRVKVWFVPIFHGHGASNRTVFSFVKSSGNKVTTLTPPPKMNLRTMREGSTVNAGQYVAHVRITYQTRGKLLRLNQWANPNPNNATSHTFTFRGL